MLYCQFVTKDDITKECSLKVMLQNFQLYMRKIFNSCTEGMSYSSIQKCRVKRIPKSKTKLPTDLIQLLLTCEKQRRLFLITTTL